jgi:Fe-S oxidoreductase
MAAPGLAGLVKRIGGVDPRRPAPKFAEQTFRAWFADQHPDRLWRRGNPVPGQRPVILWPDTFNNFFHPRSAQATLEVLEAAGFDAVIPARDLCCGRPLYDYGMLDLARRLLVSTLRELRPLIQAGVPLVGVEPSCLAVFRDELPELLSDDLDARRLSEQSFTLAELLEKRAEGWEPPRLSRQAVMHGHCHHKAVMGLDSDTNLLEKMGVDVEVLESGCCGLAGSFGFEKGEKYDVSIAAGERVLLPAVREAPDTSLIVSDGFSCRTQIEQSDVNQRPMHLAEVLAAALRGEQPRPERPSAPGRAARTAAVVAGVAAAAAVPALAWLSRRSR